MKFRNNKEGVSMFEVVVVVGIFALVAILTTRSTFLTLRGSRKSDSQIKVKENLEYALSIIERALRNSDSVSATCGSTTERIDYTDSQGTSAYFSCQSIDYIASVSATLTTRLTTPEVSITDCSFICTEQEGGTPTEVEVDLTAEEVGSSGVESSSVTTSTTILLRNY